MKLISVNIGTFLRHTENATGIRTAIAMVLKETQVIFHSYNLCTENFKLL
jgi:hypothetical protein